MGIVFHFLLYAGATLFFFLGDACLFIKFLFLGLSGTRKGQTKGANDSWFICLLGATGLGVGALYYLDSNFHKVASVEPPAVIKPPAGCQR